MIEESNWIIDFRCANRVHPNCSKYAGLNIGINSMDVQLKIQLHLLKNGYIRILTLFATFGSVILTQNFLQKRIVRKQQFNWIEKQVFRGKRNVMTHYLQGYLALFQYSELHTMMIGSKMFQDEFMRINNILSGIRNKDICPEVNLYKTMYECWF